MSEKQGLDKEKNGEIEEKIESYRLCLAGLKDFISMVQFEEAQYLKSHPKKSLLQKMTAIELTVGGENDYVTTTEQLVGANLHEVCLLEEETVCKFQKNQDPYLNNWITIQ